LRKGGVVNVTVGKGEDGKDKLVLDAIPEATPVKPKPEAEVEEAVEETEAKVSKPKAPKKSAPKDKDGGSAKARAMVDADVIAETTPPGAHRAPARKGSTVPRVPKSK
jgi:ATP-dependent Clp protease ATP-binding subunit ClpA